MFVFMWLSQFSLLQLCSMFWNQEMWGHQPISLFLLFNVVLAIWGFLRFHMNFWMTFSTSEKKKIATEILIGSLLNLYIALDSMDILTLQSFSIHADRNFFQLSVSSLISFSNVLQFSVYKSFVFFVNFIPKYFILFDATINGTSLISLSDYLLLVHRNTSDFCMLI